MEDRSDHGDEQQPPTLGASLRRKVLEEHKGKTVGVSIGAIIMSIAAVLPAEWTAGFKPATQAYVDLKITQATKGVPFLVKREAAKDVEPLWQAVNCMNRFDLAGALSRALEDYRNSTGEDYVPKTCEQLKAKSEAVESSR